MATKLPPGLLDGLRSVDPSARLLSVTGLAELVRVSYGAGAAALGLILRESGAVPSLAAILGDGAEARQSALFVLANMCSSSVDPEAAKTKQQLWRAGGGARLAAALAAPDVESLTLAVALLQNACDQRDWCQFVVGMGLMPRLEGLVDHADANVSRYAAGAIRNVLQLDALEAKAAPPSPDRLALGVQLHAQRAAERRAYENEVEAVEAAAAAANAMAAAAEAAAAVAAATRLEEAAARRSNPASPARPAGATARPDVESPPLGRPPAAVAAAATVSAAVAAATARPPAAAEVESPPLARPPAPAAAAAKGTSDSGDSSATYDSPPLWRRQAAAVGGARPLHRWASAQDAVPAPEDDGRPSFLKRQLAVSKQARGALSAAEAEAAAAEEEAAARRGFASPTKQQMGQVIAATEARVRAESQREAARA